MESQFERLLIEKISIMKDMRVQGTLIKGLSLEDYNYNIGYIEALGQVIDAMETIQTQMREE